MPYYSPMPGTYTPDPFKNFTPRQNPVNQAVVSGNELIIRYDMSQEEWNALADTKLQELLQTTSGALLLAVIRESKDRIEGKPVQRILEKTQSVSEDEPMSELAKRLDDAIERKRVLLIAKPV